MGTNNISIHYLDQAAVDKLPDGTPVCRLTTTWVLTNLGGFWIDLTIVGPKPEQPESRFALSRREAQGKLQEISDLVKSFKKELR